MKTDIVKSGDAFSGLDTVGVTVGLAVASRAVDQRLRLSSDRSSSVGNGSSDTGQ